MADRDVLICGSCSSQFSDLKIFIEHKQTCGNAVTSNANNAELSSVITVPQQSSHIGTQPIVLPSAGHASIVNIPVGMSHVILQASGLSQMYRIVLEPNLSTSTQITAAGQGPQVNHIYNLPQATDDKNAKANYSTKVDISEKDAIPVVDLPNVSFGEVTLTRLSPLTALDSTSWNANRPETRSTELFDAINSTTVVADKGILDSSKLAPEDRDVDLSFFNSHQQQNSKCRESAPSSKYASDLQEGFHQTQEESIIGETELKAKTKGLSCQYINCAFFTLHKKDMIRHVRKHTGEKPFQCTECDSRFSRQDKLKIHLRIHSSDRPYACTEPGCSYKGNEKAHLIKHRRTHTNERPFRCQFCPYRAKDASHLTVHLRSHTGDNPFYCQKDGCSATFKTSSDLKRHEKIHTGIKPHKCSDCDYASAIKSNLKVHYRINHYKGEKYGCKSCSFIGTSRKQFKEHEKAHIRTQPHPRNTLIEGIERRKPSYPKPRRHSRPAISKNFKCDKCGTEFVREDSLRSHMRQHDRKEGPQGNEQLQPLDPLQSLSKAKGKNVYTLNIVLQGDSYSAREISTPEKQPVMLMEKQTKQNTDIPHAEVSEPVKSGVTTNDTLSYIFSMDGLTSTYSNIEHQSKEADNSIVSHSNIAQDEPLVHVISTPIMSQTNLSPPTQHTTIINHPNASHPTCVTTPTPVTQHSNTTQHRMFTSMNHYSMQNLNSATTQQSPPTHYTFTTHVSGAKAINANHIQRGHGVGFCFDFPDMGKRRV